MFISEAAKQYDDVTKKTKEFQKHEKLLAEKIIAADLGIKKAVITRHNYLNKPSKTNWILFLTQVAILGLVYQAFETFLLSKISILGSFQNWRGR